VGKGFPWVEVVQVVKFTEELLKETKGKECHRGHVKLSGARDLSRGAVLRNSTALGYALHP
jgi:hypothetical protein